MRAIILAAGMGTRLRPLTYKIPKSLIKVNGKPMIERQIEFLKDIGIDNIIILTGYLSEKFEYLKSKYYVRLVKNDKYDTYNNIYSMYLVRDYLPNSYVIDADTYLQRNFLERNIKVSTYFSGKKYGFKNEWKLCFDNSGKIYDIEVHSGEGYIMSGVSYWSQKDGEYIKGKLKETIEKRDFKDLYWDNVAKDNLDFINVYIKSINSNDWFEIDSLEDLKKLESYNFFKSTDTENQVVR